jgi:glutathione reductase (NADPH)
MASKGKGKGVDEGKQDEAEQDKAKQRKYDYDYLVIGGGSGGIASARRAASHGFRVGLIEKGAMGGTCVNVGCVPKKVMFNAAHIAECIHDMGNYGFTVSGSGSGSSGATNESNGIDFSWEHIKARRDGYVARLNKIYDANMNNSGIEKIAGEASLTSTANEVLVQDDKQASKIALTADKILIATGGYPVFPDGEGIAEHGISSDGFFKLDSLPKKAVIVGAGYIAVELAGVLKSLGSDVTLVLRKNVALRDFDDLVYTTLDREMTRQGIRIVRDTGGVKSIKKDGRGKKTVNLLKGGVRDITDVDEVIFATGRSPLVEPLNLPAAAIQQLENGKIQVDEYSRTSRPDVFAVGDVSSNVELTPMAIAAGRRLADRLFGGQPDAKVSYDLVPTVVFSHPPIGTCGLTEAQARDKYGDAEVKVYTSKFANLWYGVFDVPFDEKPVTAMKLVVAGPTEVVVGVHIIGIGADEMLQGFGVAMKMGATKADFDSSIAIHPTASEELVTMAPWGLGPQETGAKVSPLNGADVSPKSKL